MPSDSLYINKAITAQVWIWLSGIILAGASKHFPIQDPAPARDSLLWTQLSFLWGKEERSALLV